MIPMTASEIAQIVSGELYANPNILVDNSIVIDSREVNPGSMFVAKKGEKTDGNRFIYQAISSGASLILTENHDLYLDAPKLVVSDVVVAMGKLAAHIVETIRSKGLLKVIGITGSVGKTTTKDILFHILSQEGSTIAPVGSYNGEVGLPLTVFRADIDTRFLVLEIGGNKIGDIAYLSQLMKPDVGVVLTVGNAHSGEFGGEKNIAIAKSELVKSLPPDGVAVLNQDDIAVSEMSKYVHSSKVFWFNSLNQSGVHAKNVHLSQFGQVNFDMYLDGDTYSMKTTLYGIHNVSNILAAVAASRVLNISNNKIFNSIKSFKIVSKWRMEVSNLSDGTTIINDAYNASPQSMKAALKYLAYIGEKSRTWAVLGTMKELGETSIKEHDIIGSLVVRLNIKKLLVIGEEARAIYQRAILEGSWGEEAVFVQDISKAKNFLIHHLKPKDIVLFKASNSVGLGLLGDYFSGASTKNFSEEFLDNKGVNK